MMPKLLTLLVATVAATVCVCVASATMATLRPECTALMRLYEATNGPSWRRNGGWGVPADCCAWDGIVCTTANVTFVSLPDSGLTGTLPDSLDGLDDVVSFILSHNEIAGTLPVEWNAAMLPRATTIDVSHNRLTGGIPPQWATFTADLKLQHNALDGTIAATPTHPLKAEQLDVSHNALTGSLPCGVYKLAKFNHNRFSGSIPSTCFNVTTFDIYCFEMDLSFNELTGTLDGQWLEDATGISCGNLFLRNNQLQGTIDPNIQLNADALQLTLDHNNFTGSVPCGILGASLSFNQFSGSLPSCPGPTSYNDVQLSNNRLSGTLPAAWGLQFLGGLDLSFNAFDGTIPASWYTRGIYNPETINVSHNFLSGSIPEVPNEAVGAYLGLDFSSNRLSGSIPASWFSAFNPFAVNLSHNALTGSVNMSFAHGPNTYVRVTSVDLSDNGLSGTPTLSHVPATLTTLVLSANHFSGTFDFDALPSAMRNASNRVTTCAQITNGNAFCGPSTSVCPVPACD